MVNPADIERRNQERIKKNREQDEKADVFFEKYAGELRKRGLFRNVRGVGQAGIVHVVRGDTALTHCVLDGEELNRCSAIYGGTGREDSALYVCSNPNCEMNQAEVKYFLHLNEKDKEEVRERRKRAKPIGQFLFGQAVVCFSR